MWYKCMKSIISYKFNSVSTITSYYTVTHVLWIDKKYFCPSEQCLNGDLSKVLDTDYALKICYSGTDDF